MRMAGVVLLALLVGVGGVLFALLLAHQAAPFARGTQPVPQSYYRLTRDTPAVRFRLDPGANLIKLRLRAEDATAPIATSLGVQVLDADEAPCMAPLSLSVSLKPQDPATRTAWLSSAEATPSLSTTRILRVETGPYGGGIIIQADTEAPVTLVRAFAGGENLARGGAGKGRWYRIAAGSLGGRTPNSVTVLTEPAEEEPGAEEETAPEALAADPAQIWHSRLFLLASEADDTPVTLPLVESVAGAIRVTARSILDETTAELSSGFAYRILGGGVVLAKGQVRDMTAADPTAAFADPHAITRVRDALANRGVTVSGPLLLGRALTRYLPYPPGAEELAVEALPDIATPTYVSFAAWSGPSGGVGLGARLPDATMPLWRWVAPANASGLAFAGRATDLAVLRAPEPPPPSSTVLFTQLAAAQATPNELLEAVPAGAPPGSLTRVGAESLRVCPIPAPRVVSLRVRLADPHRLGSTIKAHLGPMRTATLTLLTTALTYHLDNLPLECVDLRVEGLDAADLALIDAAAAPGAPTWARRQVWSAEPGSPLRFSVAAKAAQIVTVHAYAAVGARLLLRAAVDDTAPRRNQDRPAQRATVPVVQAALTGGVAADVLLTTEPGVRLGNAVRLGVPIGDDLTPGRHQVSVTVVGSGRAWIRASVRDRDLPAQPLEAKPQ